MAIKTDFCEQSKRLTVNIEGRFDFSNHKDFRNAYASAPENATFTVDLSKTEYMDSSALGMLLLLREHAGGDAGNVTIVGCNAEIKKILNLSNFDKMFQIQ